MKNLRIFSKIFLAYTIIGFVSVTILSVIFYTTLKNSLIDRTIDQLSSINVLKKKHVETYFARREKDLVFFLGKTDLASGLAAFNSKIKTSEDHARHSFQELSEIQSIFETDNITLVDSSFQKIYSTNRDTSYLQLLFNKSIFNSCESCREKKFSILDLSIHNPSKKTLLVYVLPLYNKGNTIAGFLFVKENLSKIIAIINERSGMGTTGESYIVGNDLHLRSPSRFFPGKAPLSIQVKEETMRHAKEEINEQTIIKDYRDEEVLSIYRKLTFSGLHWIIVSEIDYKEALQPINKLKSYFIGITLAIFLLILLVSYFVSSAIAKPILTLKDRILNLGKGIITKEKLNISSNDEIGQITQATNQLIEGMYRTKEFAYEIGSGNFKANYTTLSEQDSLGLALLSMRDKLKSLTERQIRLVREKSAALIEGQELERKRIVMELHDGVGQLLTVVKLRMEMIEGQDEIKQEIRQLMNETIAEVRRISYNVMPSSLVDFGLEATLKGVCENIKKYSQLSVDFNYVKETEDPLDFDIRIAVYRIVQEGLNNIIKHAKASEVILDIVESKDSIYVLLKDNGIGINESTMNKAGFGLNGMKERAKLLEGEVNIQSSADHGTTIEIEIPLSRAS